MANLLTYRKSNSWWLLTLGILLLAASIWIYNLGDYLLYRFLRGLTVFCYLIAMFFMSQKPLNKLVVLFTFCYGSSSVLTIWYEDNVFAILSMSVNVLGLLLLLRAVIPKVSFKRIGVFLGVGLALLIIINSYILYEFIWMMRDFTLSNAHYLSILLNCMALVALGFCAMVYNHVISSPASLTFTLFVFALIFSEVFRAIAYYDFELAEISVYLARALLIVAFSLLVHFTTFRKTQREQLISKLF
ncbi:hypothetical protein [Altibacter sp. HG106]|uniref:hypothetical protein n=1 Tax=Altibacter sp. HG106 TaxID=3023937 RepID=UPI002350D157|nr:hypothetical protein [Altibacter sp. HG106]MDC7995797.1 hypothetical protein [Altibacter sp. HG106]